MPLKEKTIYTLALDSWLILRLSVDLTYAEIQTGNCCYGPPTFSRYKFGGCVDFSGKHCTLIPRCPVITVTLNCYSSKLLNESLADISAYPLLIPFVNMVPDIYFS